jgi:hypothetical protein
MSQELETMNPMTDDLRNEKGQEGTADAFFFMEAGQYRAVLLAQKHWNTPKGHWRSKKVSAVFTGWTARELAKSLREAGWEPPPRLAHLCESAPRSNMQRRKR